LGSGSFEIQNLKYVALAVVLAPLFGFGFVILQVVLHLPA
jgi:hypothetical protein